MPDLDIAQCRGCGRELDGRDYRFGGEAFVPNMPNKRGPRERAKVNFYGGFVCSRECDWRASLRHEQSMPGHYTNQTRLGCSSMESFNRNWNSDA